MLAEVLVYIGTVTSGASEGIYLSLLNLETGRLSVPVLAVAANHPNFLTTDPENRFLYCTGKPAGQSEPFDVVSAFSIDRETGGLTPINGHAGEALSFCHISTALGGRVLLGADYGNGKVATFPLGANGRIGPVATVIVYDEASAADPSRQDAPHVHSINPDVAGRFVFVCDFSADKVRSYALDPEAMQLAPAAVSPTTPGSGPRHLVCHPNGKWVYVINELGGSISAFDANSETGSLTHKQTVPTLPPDFDGKNTTAEIALSPNLRFLYGSNRGHDSIVCYRVDRETGLLTQQAIVSTEGEHPRNFAIDPTGRVMLVSNRDTDNVVVFRLNPETGIPAYTGHQIQLSNPMGIKIMLPK
jgi:6-phosphogluconolactonase